MFGSKNVEISTNYWEAPSERMFKEKFTKLKIQVTINPGDRFTQDEMIRNREQFLELHSGHEAQQTVKTHNHTVLTYFVGDNKVVSRIFTRTIYWIFALLGLSLPYRWFVFFTVGHVDFRIKKRVFKPDVLQCTTPPLLLPLIPTAPMDSSLMEFQTPSPPPSPSPSSLPQSTPPPDYNTACSLLFQNKFEQETSSEI